jgi:hypothetical protein
MFFYLSDMTLYQFRLLDVEEQLGTAIYEGDFVGDRIEENYMVLLYQVHSFYVEVYYSPISNEILKHRSFSSTNQLEPYLSQVNLSELTL